MGKTTDLTPEELAAQSAAEAQAEAAVEAQAAAEVEELELTTFEKLEEVIEEYKATTSENTPFYFVILQNLEEALAKMK